MFRTWQLSLIPLSVALLTAADQPWKDKQSTDWNARDTKQILTDSPWAKTVKAAVVAAATPVQRTPAGGGRRMGGVGIGIPGMGRIGGYPGGGYPGGGYPGGGYPGGGYPSGGYPSGNNGDYPGAQQAGGNNRGNNAASQPPELTLRWESALPVRAAVMKARDANAPTLDDGYYAMAVYGVPGRTVDVESKTLAGRLKGLASIRRDGQKDLKPSKVLVLQRDSGPVFVYLFARSKNKNKPIIKQEDRRLDFEAQIGRLKFGESFFLEDMVYEGNFEI